MEVQRFLSFALSVVRALARVHDQSQLHTDLRPEEILIHSRTLEAICVRQYGRDDLVSVDTDALAYISPEQTGRLKRRVDHRSDLYSLGVIFYEMLTGRLPFRAAEPIEWVHAHIANAPDPLGDQIPRIVSMVIGKCLAKLPEDRYQSAYGLIQDLLAIREMDEAGVLQADFALGAHDVPHALRISRNLYGRSAALEELDRVFRMASAGRSSCVCVVGEPGMGKTALVEQFLHGNLGADAFIAVGRGTQETALTPYGILAGAWAGLARRLLVLDDAALRTWRAQLATLSDGSGLLHDVMPELNVIIERPGQRLSDTTADLSQILCSEMLDFLRPFATAEHPLIVFLDDVQWIDDSSRALLPLFLRDARLRNVMWIFAMRSDESRRAPEILRTFRGDDSDESKGSVVELDRLTQADVTQMLVDTLQLADADVARLARMVHHRTLGNPYYVRHFLLALVQRGCLRFDLQTAQWRMDYDEIAALPAAGNVLEFLSSQTGELPAPLLDVLAWASCFGRIVPLKALGQCCAVDEAELILLLLSAADQGFIVLGDAKPTQFFRFAHDEAQQALYSLVDPDVKMVYHERIADVLARTDDGQTDVYVLAGHLNRGLRTRTGREQRAAANLAAGRAARESGSFSTALVYLHAGCDALPETDWSVLRTLKWELLAERFHCEFASGQYAAAEESLEVLRGHAAGLREETGVRIMEIKWHTHFERLDTVLQVGLDALRGLGFRTPPRVTTAVLLRSLASAFVQWRFRRPEALADLPEMTDDRIKAQLAILHVLGPAAFRKEPRLQMMLSLQSFTLTMKHGYCPDSSTSLSTFAMVLGNVFGWRGMARRMGLASLAAAKRSGLLSQQLSAQFTFGLFTNILTESLVDSLTYLQRASTLADQAGDPLIRSSARVFSLIFEWFAGVPLDRVEEFARTCQAEEESAGDSLYRDFHELVLPVVRWLRDERREGVLPPATFPQQWERTQRKITAAVLLQGYYIAGDLQTASGLVAAVQEIVSAGFSDAMDPEWFTLAALVAAAQADDGSFQMRIGAIGRVRGYMRRLRPWAKSSPASYRHKKWLLDAEECILRGRGNDALRFYDRAAEQATRNGYHQYAGIAMERAAVACRRMDRLALARFYMRQAIESYRSWSALGKVRQLHVDHPDLLYEEAGERVGPTFSSLDEFARNLDMSLIIDVTRSISEEVIVERLLRKLLRSMVLHTGAQRGVILLEREGGLYVEVEGGAEDDSMIVQRDVPLPEYPSIAESVVQYVWHTLETLVLPDARRDSRFASDPHILAGNAVSVICEPIVRVGKVIGVVYLEHASVPQLFTEGQIRFVSIIGAQAAISIENAYLYRTLEERVVERTDELRETNESLQEINTKLSHSETLRQQMISDISHDLRTPLTSIQGYIEAILEGVVVGPEASKYLSVALERVVQINRLIQDLLDLSKMDERQRTLHTDMISLLDLVHSLSRKYEFDVRRAGLRFALSLDAPLRRLDQMGWDEFSLDEEIFISVDSRRIDQVFGNLVGNAIRHTASGGLIEMAVSLGADAQGESAEPGENSGYVHFAVKDTGSGIPPRDLPYVFERFYKGDRSRTKDSGSSGLGLAISKAIVESHDGKIWVTSELGVGTQFHVLLPIAISVADGAEGFSYGEPLVGAALPAHPTAADGTG